jgi:c-di-GMP-binding flagellar brake protein YcgR
MTVKKNDEVEKEGIERRKSFRLDMEKELMDIAWQNDSGVEQRKKMVCLDFSRGGIKLDSDVEIPVDTPITATFKVKHPKSQHIKGKILRCVKQANGWFEIALIFDNHKDIKK